VLIAPDDAVRRDIGTLLATQLGFEYLDGTTAKCAPNTSGRAVVGLSVGTHPDLAGCAGTHGADAIVDGAGAIVRLDAIVHLGAIVLPDAPPPGEHAGVPHRDGEAGWHAATVPEPLVLSVAVDGLSAATVVQRILDGLGRSVDGWLPGPYAAVVLDLDGLLVETETIWRRAKQVLFHSYGAEYEIADHRAVFGTSDEFTARYFATRFGVGDDRVPAIRDAYLETVGGLFAAGVSLRPGALELVRHLRGRVPLALASNTRRELVELILDRAALTGRFDALVTGDEGRAKPEPDLYLLACARLGVEPAAALGVEDSPTGVRAAKAAGLTCICVPSDPDVVAVGADRVVPSLLDLLEPDVAAG
jgi:HAD superfamily hydrolase (TIGR01509 family)